MTPRPATSPRPAGSASARRRGMTLLEILGVMLIFFIIWAFVFPAAEGLVRNSSRRRASADVHAIAAALLEYRRVYGTFPGVSLPDGSDSGDFAYLSLDGDALPTVDGGVTMLDSSILLDGLLPNGERNPRCIAFLEPDASGIRDHRLVDPWGEPYVAVVDGDGNGWVGTVEDSGVGEFTIRISAERTHNVPPLRDTVYVFSWTQTGVESNRVASTGGR